MLTFKVIILLLFSKQIVSLIIPPDVELLDGYNLDDSAEYYARDPNYFEAEGLSNPFHIKAIRNKRSPLEVVSNIKNDIQSTLIPNIEGKKNNADSLERERRSEKTYSLLPSQLPLAEKQTADAEFYNKGSWNTQTLHSDYNTKKNEDDSFPDSTNNGGIKGRIPRVNFITQQPQNNDNDRRIFPKLAPFKSRYQKTNTNNQDFYPSRSYDPYLRRYDRYDDHYNRNDQYYENYYLSRRRFDPFDSYNPRYPYHPQLYYYYPDRRYDIPEPRDYRPLYENRNYDDRVSELRSPNENHRSRRIIYYAHLPEIVRNPTSADVAHRYDRNSYDNQNYIGPESGALRIKNQNFQQKDIYENGYVNRERKDQRIHQSYGASLENNKTSHDPK